MDFQNNEFLNNLLINHNFKNIEIQALNDTSYHSVVNNSSSNDVSFELSELNAVKTAMSRLEERLDRLNVRRHRIRNEWYNFR